MTTLISLLTSEFLPWILGAIGMLFLYMKGRKDGSAKTKSKWNEELRKATDEHLQRISQGRKARDSVRDDIRNNPDSLHEDDGFRRD